MKRLQSKYIRIKPAEGGVDLYFEPTFNITYGSRPHALTMLKRVKRIMKREGLPRQVSNGQLRAFVPADAAGVSGALEEIDRLIEKIANRVLQPQEVEQLLAITSKERLRWTKDGRLPYEGEGSFKKGTNISFFTYPASKILYLASRPAIIADWRATDAKTGG